MVNSKNEKIVALLHLVSIVDSSENQSSRKFLSLFPLISEFQIVYPEFRIRGISSEHTYQFNLHARSPLGWSKFIHRRRRWIQEHSKYIVLYPAKFLWETKTRASKWRIKKKPSSDFLFFSSSLLPFFFHVNEKISPVSDSTPDGDGVHTIYRGRGEAVELRVEAISGRSSVNVTLVCHRS